MAERVYVPGYGYVTKGEPGTGVTSRPGYKSPTPAPSTKSLNGTQRGIAAQGGGTPGAVANGTVANPTVPRFTPRPTTGVAFPLSGYGGFGGMGGYEYGRRMGPNPDALEAFPYGVAYRTEKDAINSYLELDPDYQQWLDNLAENPLIGTSASSGRMLWERISGLAAERTEMGKPASPQQIAAEIAASVGLPPNVGRDKEIDWSGSSGGGGSYGGGGGGYGGGGGGGGQVSLTNPTAARGLLMQTMQSVLGRNPTGEEYKTFLQVLNEAEMANPQTASVEGDVVVGSGGVDPGVLALEFAQDQTDFQERQGDGYFRTFMQALAGGN